MPAQALRSYRLYGLGLASDEALPALVEAGPGLLPDVTVHVGDRAPAAEFELLEPWAPPGFAIRNGGLGYRIYRDPGKDLFLFRYPDRTDFVLDQFGRNVWMSWDRSLTLADAVTYLVGPIIGFILRWRGRLALHASCVICDGDALALMGSAGMGKSTTASAFARYGSPVISDDITALEESEGLFIAHPGYPRTCLWPESVSAFYGSADALPRITPSWDKRHLDLRSEPGGFSESPAPLKAIYVLFDRSGKTTIRAMDKPAALMSLLANTYGNRLLDADMRATEFATLDRLVRAVPVREIVVPASIQRLGEACDAIVRDFREIRAGLGVAV